MRKSAKIAIIILAVLLTVSITALIAVLIYHKHHNVTGEETLRDNRISGAENAVSPGTGAFAAASSLRNEMSLAYRRAAAPSLINNKGRIFFDDVVDGKIVDLQLNTLNPGENEPFYVDNMFPGDSSTKYYRLNVSYKEKVDVLFRAVPRPGYEFLANRLQIRVYLETTKEELYSGSIGDMDVEVVKHLTHAEPGTEELLYKITVSLDTAAGNEYQDKETWLRFDWTVRDKSDLTPPKTGLSTEYQVAVIVSVVSFGLLVLLLIVWRRRKRQKENEA